jgi:cytochrome c oxidase assembly protein subunit 15
MRGANAPSLQPRAVSPALTARGRAPIVRAWLATVALLVLAMVLVGGITRLTDSGLSIIEWRPLTGAVPPLSEDAWLGEFGKYRQTPEYQRVNAGMSFDAFKAIYWWEWGHRFLGRLIGLVFLVPFVALWWRGWFTRRYLLKLGGLLVLGGLQGAVGWWMVASGLVDRVDVSQYRLAVHLLLACCILAAVTWLILDLSPLPRRKAPRHQRLAIAVLALLFVQIGAGALVAGLDAGLSHNTWPLIDGRLIPPLDSLHAMRPAWQNHFDNVLTVQFQHRMLAYAVLGLTIWQAVALARDAPGTPVARSAALVMVLALIQSIVGITTLLLHVPILAALSHQALAMMLLVAAVWHAWRVGSPAGAVARMPRGRPTMDPNCADAVSPPSAFNSTPCAGDT